MHTEAHLFSVPNDCLWNDKLWGPSQRVVTLFLECCAYKYFQNSALMNADYSPSKDTATVDEWKKGKM